MIMKECFAKVKIQYCIGSREKRKAKLCLNCLGEFVIKNWEDFQILQAPLNIHNKTPIPIICLTVEALKMQQEKPYN